MKNNLLVFATLVCSTLFGQSFSVNGTDTIIYGAINASDISAYFNINNDSTVSFPMSWEVDTAMIQTNWGYSVCDPNVCHPEGVTSGAFNLSTSPVNRILNIHFYPNNTAGQSEVRINLWQDDMPDSKVVLNWTGIVGTSNLQEKYNLNLLILTNSLNRSISFSLNQNDNKMPLTIDLFDLTGRKVDSKTIDGVTEQITFEKNLLSGIYLYSISTNGYQLTSGKTHL